jgi:hypothetical protein
MLPCYWHFEKILIEESSTKLVSKQDDVVFQDIAVGQPSDSKQLILLNVNNRGLKQ